MGKICVSKTSCMETYIVILVHEWNDVGLAGENQCVQVI